MNKKRIKAGIIDFIIACLFQAVLMFFFVIKPYEASKFATNFIPQRTIFITILSALYLVLRDLPKNQSIGKRIFKLKCVDISTKKIAHIKYRFLRNMTLLIAPVDILFLLVRGKRLGDILANTDVIN